MLPIVDRSDSETIDAAKKDDMKRIAQRSTLSRRRLFALSLAGAIPLVSISARATPQRVPFDRKAYNHYVGLMNEGDLRFTDYYAEDIKFIMNIRGKVDVMAFYDRQRLYVKETLQVLFFCSDSSGAAAQVHSELRCIRDCEDSRIFGRALKAGEVQQVRGCLLYDLDAQGKIGQIMGPPPEIITPWRPGPN